MSKHLIILLVLMLTAAECWSVQPYQPVHPDPVLEPWRWRVFPELKGLGLRSMAQSKDGAMWFGTDTGVLRYDGVQWTAYTPQDGLLGDQINVLVAARDGGLYAGSDLGISRFVGGAWRRVFPTDGDLSWPVDQIAEASDGRVWAATAWGLLCLSSDGTTVYTTADMADALKMLAPEVRLSIVPNSVVSARSWQEGIGVQVVRGAYMGIRRDNTPKVIWKLAPDGTGMKAGLKVGDAILSVDGDVSDAALSALDGLSGTPVALVIKRPGVPEPFEITVTRGFASGQIRDFSTGDVYEDRAGRMWCWRSRGGELMCYSPAGEEGDGAWESFDVYCGMGSRPRILQTRDGTTWVTSSVPGRGVSRFDGKMWTHYPLQDLGGNHISSSLLETSDGAVWVGGHQGRLHIFKDGIWQTYKPSQASIPLVRLIDLVETSDGAVWIAGLGKEVVRIDYQTDRWTTYKGLRFECESPEGTFWFVTVDKDVVCTDGTTWIRYGQEDGLMDNVEAVIVARDGVMWAAGSHRGRAAVAHFNPQTGSSWFRQVHADLGDNIDFNAVFQAVDGALWFSAYGVVRGQMGGLLRFDGTNWEYYRPTRAPQVSYAIDQTPDGVLWFGPALRRFDGRTWTMITEPRELTSWIHDMCVSRDGMLWVGTRAYGIFCFDGHTWSHHDMRDGLADNQVDAILQTSDGSIWAATAGGYSRFDGHTWVTFALPAEFKSRGVRGRLKQSGDGALWFSETGWITVRYQADTHPPDTELALSLKTVSQPGNTTLAWKGMDPWRSTPHGELQYAWRLDGGEWSPFSKETHATLLTLSSGDHTFQVKARDRDFNEDPTPAVVQFTVVPPVWRQPWFIGMVVVFVGVIGLQASRIVVRTRERDRSQQGLIQTQARLVDEMEEELQTAHDLQMGLMPREHPQLEGFDIAGRCIPANHVGGDFFQYFNQNSKLAVTMADVAGHAMDAAIPVVMFSGVLDSQMELGGSVEDLFARLNGSMYRNLGRLTFVCFQMGELDPSIRSFRFSNGGCPYPYHFQAATGEVAELEVAAYPLGVRPDTDYQVVETQLHPGDRVIFCSDGIAEAENTSGEQFGYDRTEETVLKSCEGGLSAEATIDCILEAVATFKGDSPQGDDMTCVVVRVEDVDGSA